MGQTASRAGSKSYGIVITLDALGTIYRFRKPFAEQYLEVAQKVGIKPGIQVEQVQQAFRQAYKTQVSRYPNYGLESLSSPSEWWHMLVRSTFTALINEVPEELPGRLYDHFSSADAYELFPDVQPFLHSLHNLRTQFSEPKGPSIITGIITNSDPRVLDVLRALSLTVGKVKIPTRDAIRESAAASAVSGQLQTPWSKAYNMENNFDFLVTGYEAGAEKPNAAIWQQAEARASLVSIAKSQIDMKLPSSTFMSGFVIMANAVSNIGRTEGMQWIHIGDDLEKDYWGAKAVGKEALLIDREGVMKDEVDKVASLEEAATIVNLMAQEILERKS